MKPLQFTLIALLPLGSLSAASIYDFQSETDADFFTSEVSGWTQSSANPSIDGVEFPLAFIANTTYFGGSNLAGHLGTQYGNNPLSATTSVTGSLAGAGKLVNSQVSVDFAIAASSNPSFAVRDAFAISVTAAGIGTAASFTLTPNDVDTTLWSISYTINGVSGSTGFALTENSDYTFYFNFLEGTTELSYGSTSLASVATSFDVDADLADIVISHTQTDFATNAGHSLNSAVFDNISVTPIPEPSASLLAGVAALGLLRRRRAN